MTRPQWWLDPTDLDVLALCRYLASRPSNSNPDHIEDFVAPSGDRDRRRLIYIAEDEHLLRSEPRWADGGDPYNPVVITESGRRRVRTADAHLSRRDEWMRAARDGLLLWAYDYAISNPDLPMNRPSRFLDADPAFNFWGEPFTEGQVREATNYLIESGLLELHGRRLGSGEPQNVMITSSGKDCVDEYGGSVAAYRRRQSAANAPRSYTQNFNGPFQGQAAQGDSISQTQHNGVDRDTVAAIFTDLRALLTQVENAEVQSDLTLVIDDLERAANYEEPDLDEVSRRSGLLNRLASNVCNTAVTTSTNAATNSLLDLLGDALS